MEENITDSSELIGGTPLSTVISQVQTYMLNALYFNFSVASILAQDWSGVVTNAQELGYLTNYTDSLEPRADALSSRIGVEIPPRVLQGETTQTASGGGGSTPSSAPQQTTLSG